MDHRVFGRRHRRLHRTHDSRRAETAARPRLYQRQLEGLDHPRHPDCAVWRARFGGLCGGIGRHQRHLKRLDEVAPGHVQQGFGRKIWAFCRPNLQRTGQYRGV